MDVTDTQQTEPTPPRRLTRSRSDRIIGGVCGGLGRYFNVDPVIFRIGAVALVFAGGASILVYLAMLLLVPSDDDVAAQPAGARNATGRS